MAPPVLPTSHLPDYLVPCLGSLVWLSQHQDTIKSCLPQEWKKPELADLVRLGFHLKIAGLDWHHETDLPKIMAYLSFLGVIHHRRTDDLGVQVKVNPEWQVVEQVDADPSVLH